MPLQGERTRKGRPPAWLFVVGAAALLFLLWLVAGSLRRPTPPTFPVTPARADEVGESLIADRTVTLDARDRRSWVLFDFSRSAPVRDPGPTGWDLAVRGHEVIVNGGEGFAGSAGAIALPGVAFGAVTEAPEAEYVASRMRDGDSTHSVLAEWYDYDFFSHVLSPRDITYVLRTADGRWAKFRVLGYYCPGPESGCLTLRYAYQGDGSRRLAPRDAPRGAEAEAAGAGARTSLRPRPRTARAFSRGDRGSAP